MSQTRKLNAKGKHIKDCLVGRNYGPLVTTNGPGDNVVLIKTKCFTKKKLNIFLN